MWKDRNRKVLYMYVCSTDPSSHPMLPPLLCNLKSRIPVLSGHGYSVKKISSILGIKKSTVYQALWYYRCYGVLYSPHAQKAGRPHILSAQDTKFIMSLLRQHHTIYLDEIQLELQEQRQKPVSLTTLSRTLQQMGLTHKTVSINALERNDLLRAAFMNKIADEVPNPDMLMFHWWVSMQSPHITAKHGLVSDRCSMYTALLFCSWPTIFNSSCLDTGWHHNVWCCTWISEFSSICAVSLWITRNYEYSFH